MKRSVVTWDDVEAIARMKVAGELNDREARAMVEALAFDVDDEDEH